MPIRISASEKSVHLTPVIIATGESRLRFVFPCDDGLHENSQDNGEFSELNKIDFNFAAKKLLLVYLYLHVEAPNACFPPASLPWYATGYNLTFLTKWELHDVTVWLKQTPIFAVDR